MVLLAGTEAVLCSAEMPKICAVEDGDGGLTMRLIDAIALYKEFMDEVKRHPIPETPGLGRYRALVWMEAAGFFITMLTKAPTIEAEPVRHGRWIKRQNERICPFCLDRHIHLGGKEKKYCSNCGAKMDGDSHDIR